MNQQRRHQQWLDRRKAEGRSTVHILHNGLPACLFTTVATENWPDGHRYLHSHQERRKVTCDGCLSAAKQGGF